MGGKVNSPYLSRRSLLRRKSRLVRHRARDQHDGDVCCCRERGEEQQSMRDLSSAPADKDRLQSAHPPAFRRSVVLPTPGARRSRSALARREDFVLTKRFIVSPSRSRPVSILKSPKPLLYRSEPQKPSTNVQAASLSNSSLNLRSLENAQKSIPRLAPKT